MVWHGAAAGIGASLGLVIGGALTSAVSWRAGFFINVPIRVAMIVIAPRYLPEVELAPGASISWRADRHAPHGPVARRETTCSSDRMDRPGARGLPAGRRF